MAEETMKDYTREIENSFRKIKEGDIIDGTVIGVTDSEVILDIKYYTQGIIKAEELSDDPKFSIHKDINVGDEVSATVISTDDGEGNILLSKRKANEVLAWDKLKALLESGEYVDVKISEAVKGGAVAFLEGIRGFIPASQLRAGVTTDDQMNKEIEAKE